MKNLPEVIDLYRTGAEAGKAGHNHSYTPKALHEFRMERASKVLYSLDRHSQKQDLIDVGCGAGSLIPYLPPWFGYTGIDPVKLLVEEARKTYPDKEFMCMAVEDCMLLRADIVVSLGVMSHVLDEDRKDFLDHLCRLSRKYVLLESQNKNAYEGKFQSHRIGDVMNDFEALGFRVIALDVPKLSEDSAFRVLVQRTQQ